VVALCACAWFLNGFRALDLEAEGVAASQRAQQGALQPSDLSRARQALRDARRFSADQGPLLAEGYLLSTIKRRAAGYEIARRVIEKEPESAQAWFLARLTAPDRRRADEAGRHLAKLNPLVDAGR
jgi:hypothetical protein